MNIKRSYLRALIASAAVGLFATNCTVKEDNSDECERGDKDTGCDCPGGLTGYQVCDSDGVFGSCICPDDTSGGGSKNTSGSSNNNSGGDDTDTGGKTNNGGTGAVTSYAGSGDGGSTEAVGGGGEGGGPVIDPADFDPTDCDACLQKLCQTEWDACFADSQCISDNVDGTGQYERISLCIEKERVNGLVKRDAVRGCGVTIGVSPDADLAADWAPEGMAATTTNLLNCLATSAQDTPNADWANSDDNFPVVDEMVVPTPWPEDSCAKLACTSKLQ